MPHNYTCTLNPSILYLQRNLCEHGKQINFIRFLTFLKVNDSSLMELIIVLLIYVILKHMFDIYFELKIVVAETINTILIILINKVSFISCISYGFVDFCTHLRRIYPWQEA